jgi:tetratricopeptide repeat protein 30
MGAARIYWDRGNYAQVERIFRQSAEFASEHEVWKLNVAHTFFMQESKYREAIRYYAPIVKEAMDNSAANAAAGGGMMGGGLVKGGLLDIPAIVLANLCVSYIMTSQNEEAEEIMRRVEAEEATALADAAAAQQAMAEGGGMVVGGAAGMLPPGARNGLGKPVFHLCIINLVIGTLYCSKGNYEFGISRVLKSLEPLDRKLGPDTWYYAKRCFVALAEVLAKHMITMKDSTFEEILSFLADCDRAGKNIVTVVAQGSSNATMTPAMAPTAASGGPGGGDGGGTNPDGTGAADASAADSATANAFSSAAAAAAALLPGLLGNGGSRTVSYEARLLRRMYMVLRDEH